MIFDIPSLISHLARVTTLTTGDLAFIGTPEGIGNTQGRVRADGDLITTQIDRIGTVTNRCVRGSDHHVC